MELQNIEKLKIKDIFYFFIKNKDKLRKFFALLAIVVGFFAAFATAYNFFFAKPNIECLSFTRCKTGNVVVYSGELINNSSYHAGDFEIKGKFNSKIIVIEIDCKDTTEKPVNLSNGYIKFSLKRFSSGNKCSFNIITDPNGEITGSLQAVWGNSGMLNLYPNKCDEKMEKGIALGRQISKLDLSSRARQKWLENNAKNIR